MNLTPEQLKQQTCEAFTAWTLAPDDKKPKVEESYDGGKTWHQDIPIFNWKRHYRLAPSPVAAGHNPEKLTEEQVGVSDGWRLLDEDEIHGDMPECVQPWFCEQKRWSTTEGRNHGRMWKTLNYRTRLTRDELAALDKPTTRPWNCAEDVPFPWPILREPDCPNILSAIVEASSQGLVLWDSTGKKMDTYPWERLAEIKPEYSADGKTWHPCTISIP